jgi:hypothetical protein
LNWPGKCDGADQELVAFAGGHAPTAGQVDLASNGQTMVLDDPVSVSVTVWVVGGLIRDDEAAFEADQAKRVFADLGTGINIIPAVKSFPDERLGEVSGLFDAAECSLAAGLTGLVDDLENPADKPGFDDGRLNVYYVKKFADTEANPAGLNCFVPDNPALSHQNVMFVLGLLNHSPTVLSHEVGHALGLLRSTPLPNGSVTPPGHVDEIALDPYLAQDNLMRSGSVDFVGQVTLGQIYRMHFDALSWLWVNRTPGVDYPRTCQNSAVEGGACPPLTLHPSRGWP